MIRLEFKYFQLEDHPTCQNDYVEVQDGLTLSSRLLGRFCGNVFPTIIESTTNKMLVRFKTNDKTVRTGFKALYFSQKGTLDVSLNNVQYQTIMPYVHADF